MSPAPLSSTAARSAAIPLPMMRKSACRSLVPILLSYHSLLMHSSDSPASVRLMVRASSAAYVVEIQAGAVRTLAAALDAAGVPHRRFIVSSPTVWRLHGESVRGTTAEEPILIPDGERDDHASSIGLSLPSPGIRAPSAFTLFLPRPFSQVIQSGHQLPLCSSA